MYKPELIKEAKGLLTKEELDSITELDSAGIGFNYNYDTRSKITDKTCWFYPSIKNFNTILSLIKPNSKVLDIGCGSAIVGKYILDKIPNVKYKGIRKSMYKVDLFKYIPDGYIEEISSTKDTVETIRQFDYDTWLLFYPPYDKPMGYEVLEEFLENNNVKTLLFLGEIDGCVGDNRFKKSLGELIYDTPDNLDVEFYDIDCYSFIRDELIKITKRVKNV